jgi:hypothetical protein
MHVPPQPGDPVRIEMSKWGNRPHWQLAATFLGSDEHGDWIGVPAGTPHARPGAAFTSEVDSVTLAPRASPWCATFNAPGIWCTVYVDMSTPPYWDGAVLRAVDLDLDVIRGEDGMVWVDDEDEFAEHQVSLGYPPEIVEIAEASRDAVRDAVRRRLAPFDLPTPAAWLAQVSELGPG